MPVSPYIDIPDRSRCLTAISVYHSLSHSLVAVLSVNHNTTDTVGNRASSAVKREIPRATESMTIIIIIIIITIINVPFAAVHAGHNRASVVRQEK